MQKNAAHAGARLNGARKRRAGRIAAGHTRSVFGSHAILQQTAGQARAGITLFLVWLDNDCYVRERKVDIAMLPTYRLWQTEEEIAHMSRSI